MLKEKSDKNIYICQIWGQANLEAKSEANFEARPGQVLEYAMFNHSGQRPKN